jgi:hypothetical protein
MMMIDDVNTILLYIFVILLLFCIMYIVFYSDQNISFYDNLDSIESSIYKYKNSFNDTTLHPYYSDDDGKAYLQSSSEFNTYILNNQNNLTNILATIENAKEETSSNNKVLMNSITNLYYKQYLESINKENAVVYNQSNKSSI